MGSLRLVETAHFGTSQCNSPSMATDMDAEQGEERYVRKLPSRSQAQYAQTLARLTGHSVGQVIQVQFDGFRHIVMLFDSARRSQCAAGAKTT